MEYPKIETIFDRDENFKVVEGKYRLPEFENIKEWYVTEKIDGTNIRIIYEPQFPPKEGGLRWGLAHEVSYAGHTLRFAGKTDKAQLHPNLITYLHKTFTIEKLHEVFPDKHIEGEPSQYPHVILFGEGYGPKIQTGGNYRKNISLRLFDVFVKDQNNPLGGWWLEPDNVGDVATKLGILTVPFLGIMTTEEAINYVKEKHYSLVSQLEDGEPSHRAEGEGTTLYEER